MFGRRSHQRFNISAPSEGTLQILRDAVIERIDGERFVVFSRYPGVLGEHLDLEFGEQHRISFEVVVTESKLVVTDGAVRHRLVLEAAASSKVGPGRPIVPGATGALAILTHRLPVRIVNYSATGCLLESTVRPEEAAISSLRLMIDGREFVDDVQVVRCQPVQGSSSYHIGVEFLWIVPPTRQSLRRTSVADGFTISESRT